MGENGDDEDGNTEELTMPIILSNLPKTVVVSTDNPSNITAAIRDSDMQHLRCFTHTLNL